MIRDSNSSSKIINVLIASHNRAQLTTACVEELIRFQPEGYELQIILVDDGSTDGTVERVRQNYPNVRIVMGDGDWYWAKSMSVGELSCSDKLNDLLWINDDVRLMPDSLSRAFELSAANPDSIIVGQCYSKESQDLTYGGLSKHHKHPFKFFLVESVDKPTVCDTFNGNFVLVPKKIRQVVGAIDGEYGHRFADLDYGLRTVSHGYTNLVIPGVIGHCERNTSHSSSNPFERVLQTASPKNLPLGAMRRFVKRHGSKGAWIFIPIPYLKAFFGVKQREISKVEP